MRTPEGRKNKRQKTTELCLFIIENEPNGIRIQDLQRLVDQAFRFRCSSNSIGQYLKPFVDQGVLEKSHTSQGNSVYRYIHPLETETHGMETGSGSDGCSLDLSEESEA